MKVGYLTENFWYYTKLSCDDKNQTQLYENEHRESTTEQGIIIIFDQFYDVTS